MFETFFHSAINQLKVKFTIPHSQTELYYQFSRGVNICKGTGWYRYTYTNWKGLCHLRCLSRLVRYQLSSLHNANPNSAAFNIKSLDESPNINRLCRSFRRTRKCKQKNYIRSAGKWLETPEILNDKNNNFPVLNVVVHGTPRFEQETKLMGTSMLLWKCLDLFCSTMVGKCVCFFKSPSNGA